MEVKSPFDVVNDINNGKKGLITASNEKQYNPFLTNRALSYFAETVLHANEMNVNSHLDPLLQHDYLFHSVRKGKRFSKWSKEVKDKNIELVAEYYGYNYRRAKEVYPLLSEQQLKHISKVLQKGKE